MYFLQGFLEDEILCELRDNRVAQSAKKQAIELAMLGLPEEANAILKLLSDNGLFDSAHADFEIECIWTYSGLQPPDIDRNSEGAVWVPSEEMLRKKEFGLRHRFTHLPKDIDWTRVDQHSFDRLLGWLNAQRDSSSSDASSGYQAMKVSAGHVALLAMASELGDQGAMLEHMSLVAKRVHANQQMFYLGAVRAVWQPYLLSGWLRERLDLTVQSLQEYAHFVLSTTRRRLEHGVFRLDDLYAGLSMAQVIDQIDQNTITDEDYGDQGDDEEDDDDEDDDDEDTDGDAKEKDVRPDTIKRDPATPEQIEQAERRLGRHMPSDMKEFYSITNGCGQVRRGEDFFANRLPALNDLVFEEEKYMTQYPFELLPRFYDVEIEWPGVTGGGIAMYEHDGQGTYYVWMVGADLIREAKRLLREAYEAADDAGKASIDRQILVHYGSRETYESIHEHCLYQQEWAGESKVFPNFRAYLLEVAYESRHMPERSPLPKPQED